MFQSDSRLQTFDIDKVNIMCLNKLGFYTPANVHPKWYDVVYLCYALTSFFALESIRNTYLKLNWVIFIF